VNSENIITADDAAAMNRMRDTLEALQNRCKAEGWQASEESFVHGKLAEACDQAENAIFNVLNIAASHLNCHVANAAIDLRQADRRAAHTLEAVND